MLVYGRNVVTEYLKNKPEDIKELLVSQNFERSFSEKYSKSLKKNKLDIKYLKNSELNILCDTKNHQGYVANVSEFEYSELQELISLKKSNKNLLIVVLDHIEDPQNLGSIIRTSAFFGVNGIVIPKDRAASVTPAVIKVSSGAAINIPIVRETNLNTVIKKLKENDIWVVGTSLDVDTDLNQIDYTDLNLAIIIGSEGRGMSKKIEEKCDYLVKIPSIGKTSSLNASVAAGIIIYQILSSKNKLVL